MNKTKAVILLAGMGSRLARPHPKALTPLGNGETILSRQLRLLSALGLPVCGVVGFKKDLIMEAAPDIQYAYNPNYDTTNTSKSLLCALQHCHDEDVLWLNGDVVFEAGVVELILTASSSAVAVNNARVAEEEVKYQINSAGFINAISKKVPHALGEALGINLIKARHLAVFKRQLEAVADQDYFERAMELLIAELGDVFVPVDVGALGCVEVDFAEDLERAKVLVAETN